MHCHAKVGLERSPWSWHKPAYAFGLSLVALIVLCADASRAVQARPMPLQRMNGLVLSDMAWESARTVRISGVPVHFRPFTSTLKPAQVARDLGKNTDIFQRVLTGKQKIVLSGLQPGWHWLAEVDAIAGGSQGYVSALYVNSVDLGSLAGQGTGAGLAPSDAADDSWLPPGSQRRFSHTSVHSRHTLTQSVYTVPVPLTKLQADLRDRLRSRGWRTDTAASGIGTAGAWFREGDSMLLFAYRLPSGVSLFVHHSR